MYISIHICIYYIYIHICVYIYIYIYIYMIINLHFTSRKTNKKTQTNKITQSPDTNVLESTWEYVKKRRLLIKFRFTDERIKLKKWFVKCLA